MSVITQYHSKTQIIPWKLKKRLPSIPTHLHSVSHQKQNSFQKYLQIRFETMFHFETMESTVEPIQSNQQETSDDTQQRQPIAVTHPDLCAAIISWQNENTIQSQDSLLQSTKAIETSPQSSTETIATADADELWNDLWNPDTLQLPSTIVASNSKKTYAATTLRKEYQDLVAARAEMEIKHAEDALQYTETQETINSLQIQLQEKQTILGKILETASNTKTAFEAATASVREKFPLADQAERAELRSKILLAVHRQNGTTFTNTMEAWFHYQDWVHPDTIETRLVGSQMEAMLYVFLDIPYFFSKVKLELFLGVVSPNHNVGGALHKMVQAQMIIMAADRNGTEQFYLGHFGMEALKRSTIPDINNRPTKYLESITSRNDYGNKMINNQKKARNAIHWQKL
jgi:hypothetical protein